MSGMISKATSNKLANMAFVCSILVVAIHTKEPPVVGSYAWWLIHIMQNVFGGIAVPFFFVVSGYMLARHFEEDGWYGREMKKRFWSLLIPYLAWSAIALYHLIPLMVVNDFRHARPFGFSVTWPTFAQVTGWKLWRFPAIAPLWYLRFLMMLCVASPLLYWLTKKGQLVFLFFLFSVHVVVMQLGGGTVESDYTNFQRFVRYGVNCGGAFYFATGIAIKIGVLKDIGASLKKLFIILAIGFIVINLVRPFYMINSNSTFNTIGTPLVLYCVWCAMPSRQWPKWLIGSSFTIFLAHMIFLKDFSIFIGGKMSVDNLCVCSFFVAVVGSIALSLIMHRYFNACSRFLLGGR